MLEHAFSAPEPDDLGRTNAVVVVQRGAIVAERYRQDVEADRAFISWSMAKSITSCLVGILVKQGRLDISQPIPVKEWSAGDKRRRITIDQMLRMTDGLRFREAEDLGDGSVRYYPEDESDVIPMLFGAGKDDVAAFAATLPYQVEPESRWNYNSGASNLLARLVRETIGGGEQEMRAFMHRELFDRIGMTTADPGSTAPATSSARRFATAVPATLRASAISTCATECGTGNASSPQAGSTMRAPPRRNRTASTARTSG